MHDTAIDEKIARGTCTVCPLAVAQSQSVWKTRPLGMAPVFCSDFVNLAGFSTTGVVSQPRLRGASDAFSGLCLWVVKCRQYMGDTQRYASGV